MHIRNLGLLVMLGPLLTSRPVRAQDACPCKSDDPTCRGAVAVVDALASGEQELEGIRSKGQLPQLLQARAVLEHVAERDPERMWPRLWSYLATASYLLGDYAGTVLNADQAANLQGHQRAEGTCRMDAGRLADLTRVSEFARDQLARVTLRSNLGAGPPLYVSARISLGTSPSETLEYRPIPWHGGVYGFNAATQTVHVEAQGYEAFERTLDVSANTTIDIVLKAKPLPPRGRAVVGHPMTGTEVHSSARPVDYWGWAAVGLAGIGTGVGLAITIDGVNDLQRTNGILKSLCPGDECASDAEVNRYHDLRHEAKLDQGRALVAGIGSGVGFIATGYLLYRALSGTRPATPPKASLVVEGPATGVLGAGIRAYF